MAKKKTRKPSITKLKKLLADENVIGVERQKWRGQYKTKLKHHAQRWVNNFIRLRDTDLTPDGRMGQCISCGEVLMLKQCEAGHYISVGASKYLRFDEKNIHVQCHKCNYFLSSNAVEYRIALIDLIGEYEVCKLERHRNDIARRSIEDLEGIVDYYKKKCKSINKHDAIFKR